MDITVSDKVCSVNKKATKKTVKLLTYRVKDERICSRITWSNQELLICYQQWSVRNKLKWILSLESRPPVCWLLVFFQKWRASRELNSPVFLSTFLTRTKIGNFDWREIAEAFCSVTIETDVVERRTISNVACEFMKLVNSRARWDNYCYQFLRDFFQYKPLKEKLDSGVISSQNYMFIQDPFHNFVPRLSRHCLPLTLGERPWLRLVTWSPKIWVVTNSVGREGWQCFDCFCGH